MIALDIETTGGNILKCGIWQIGAIELENPSNYFFEEARIDEDEEVINSPEMKETVYEVTGKTEEDFRDKNKQSQKQLLERFFKWLEKAKIANFLCQNPSFDIAFITAKAKKYELKIPYHHRSFDLHSIAQFKYFQNNSKFLIKESRSDMGLSNILKFVGMIDSRKIHNALDDTKLTAECFSRIVYGKNLFEEYKNFKIPEYLKLEKS